MTDKKLSQLSAGSAIAPSDLFYSAPTGTQVKQRAVDVKQYVTDYIDAMDPTYGIVIGIGQSSGQRIINGTGLNAAAAAAGAAHKILKLPAGFIEYTATATDTGVNTGFQVDYAAGCVGAGVGITKLCQFATNYPAITLGPMINAVGAFGAVYRDFSVGFGTDQSAHSSGHGILLGCMFNCQIERLYVDPEMVGGRTEAYIGLYNPSVNSIFFFENYINMIWVKTGAQAFWVMNANTSGNTWGVMYIGGTGSFFSDYRTPASYAIDFQNLASFGVIHELNIEWIQGGSGYAIMFINNVRGMVINQLRFEGDRLMGFSPALINTAGGDFTINELNLYNVTMNSGDLSGNPTIVWAYGEAHVFIGGGMWQFNSGSDGNGAATHAFSLFNQQGGAGVGGVRSRIEIHNIIMAGAASGVFNFDSGLPNSVTGDILQFGKYIYNPGISRVEDPKIYLTSGTTYDLYGWAIRPQVVVDFVLSATLTVTWKDTWGASSIGAALPTSSPDICELERTSASTGAFNVLLKDGAGTTITTQASAGTTNHITRNGTTLTNF